MVCEARAPGVLLGEEVAMGKLEAGSLESRASSPIALGNLFGFLRLALRQSRGKN